MNHDLALFLAKTVGLLYLMGFFILIVVHTYRPSRKAVADRAATSILTAEDRPCP
ncbi:MAG: cbb3-type cytochrome c oxidase subunit 3 [Rhodobacteraceae bacterium]|nr:cbb3-type cytochrome c oxidase subunit 3 [Paracoccaceae bacterium]